MHAEWASWPMPPPTCNDIHDQRHVIHAPPHGADGVQGARVRNEATARHAAVCGLQPHNAAKVCGLPDAAACGVVCTRCGGRAGVGSGGGGASGSWQEPLGPWLSPCLDQFKAEKLNVGNMDTARVPQTQ